MYKETRLNITPHFAKKPKSIMSEHLASYYDVKTGVHVYKQRICKDLEVCVVYDFEYTDMNIYMRTVGVL